MDKIEIEQVMGLWLDSYICTAVSCPSFPHVFRDGSKRETTIRIEATTTTYCQTSPDDGSSRCPLPKTLTLTNQKVANLSVVCTPPSRGGRRTLNTPEDEIRRRTPEAHLIDGEVVALAGVPLRVRRVCPREHGLDVPEVVVARENHGAAGSLGQLAQELEGGKTNKTRFRTCWVSHVQRARQQATSIHGGVLLFVACLEGCHHDH